MAGRIHQINIKPEVLGQRGLPKLKVYSASVHTMGIYGDFNKYRTEHKNSTPKRALLILPLETISDLNNEGWPVKPGYLGENITTDGIPYENFAI